MATIGNMTIEELEQFVETIIFRHRTEMLGEFEIGDDSDDDENLTWDEVRELVKKTRWTPRPVGNHHLRCCAKIGTANLSESQFSPGW